MLDNKRILIVEDDIYNIRVVDTILKHQQAETAQALSAEEALKMLEKQPYDCVLIDLALPVMDGWGLLDAIRANPETAGIPCVAVTAFGDASVEREAYAAGFNGYFAKPIDTVTFATTLNGFLS